MKLKKTRQELLRTLKNVFLVIIGTLSISFATSVFLLPFDLVTGGVAGYSIVIKQLIPIDFITKEIIITVLTWSLFLLGFLILGKSFALKTLISAAIYPIGTALFSMLVSPDVLGGFFDLRVSAHSGIAVVLAAVFGGVFIGLGCALSFLGGGSTGGVDVIAFTLCKIIKKLKSSVAMFLIDATAVLLGMFVIGDLVVSLLGIVSAFIAALMIDKVFLGGNKAFVAHIITNSSEEINREIIAELDRTSTIFDATGGYSGEGKKVVMVSFTMNQYPDLLTIITRIDREAFVTVHQAHEINGEGWTKYDKKPKNR